MLPELTFGGETVIDLYTPYAATQFFFNFWPVESFGVGETYLQWDPPLFENFWILLCYFSIQYLVSLDVRFLHPFLKGIFLRDFIQLWKSHQ